MKIRYPEVGVCGLSCRLCPMYQSQGKSRCGGCKSESRMAVGCSLITCAVKRRGIEFCWDCPENKKCEKWGKHRDFGKKHDSFKCYQKLEDDISFLQKYGVVEFERIQKIRERLLREMLEGFNEGRSKSYYCIAATVLEIRGLEAALRKATARSKGLGIKDRSRVLHSILDEVAKGENYSLKLRKWA